jgi:hypothetical protein
MGETEVLGPDPDVIGPDHNPKNVSYYTKMLKRTFLTREGLIGSYDYGFLFKPNLPFMGSQNVTPPFFGLNDKMPVFLAMLLGLQHSLAMLAGMFTAESKIQQTKSDIF